MLSIQSFLFGHHHWLWLNQWFLRPDKRFYLGTRLWIERMQHHIPWASSTSGAPEDTLPSVLYWIQSSSMLPMFEQESFSTPSRTTAPSWQTIRRRYRTDSEPCSNFAWRLLLKSDSNLSSDRIRHDSRSSHPGATKTEKLSVLL